LYIAMRRGRGQRAFVSGNRFNVKPSEQPLTDGHR
jgi:hypothetical protein